MMRPAAGILVAHHAEGRARALGTSPSGSRRRRHTVPDIDRNLVDRHRFEAHAGIVEQEGRAARIPRRRGRTAAPPVRAATRHTPPRWRARRLPPRSGPPLAASSRRSSVRPVNMVLQPLGDERPSRQHGRSRCLRRSRMAYPDPLMLVPLLILIKEIANGGRADKGGGRSRP